MNILSDLFLLSMVITGQHIHTSSSFGSLKFVIYNKKNRTVLDR